MKLFKSRPLDSIETYMHGLKWRAQNYHCLGDGAFPVELTKLVAMRRRYSREVRPVTLTPLFVKAVALAVRANPEANRILFQRFPFRRRIVDFDVVDVNVPITRTVNDETLIFIGVIRGADQLTIAQIQEELIRMQREPPESSPYLQKIERLKRASRFSVSVYHWLMSRSPDFYLKNAGTCGMTALAGMPGGLFFPIGPTTAVFSIGGIGDEVVARDGIPVVRRVLRAALSLDNFVASGPVGLRLALSFQQLLESCSYVEDELEAAR